MTGDPIRAELEEAVRTSIVNLSTERGWITDEFLVDFVVIAAWQPVEENGETVYTCWSEERPSHVVDGLLHQALHRRFDEEDDR
jgi:hypothetical protein